MASPVDEYVTGSVGPGALAYNAAELAGLPPSLQNDVEAVIANRNDAGAWASLAFSSLTLAAESLPSDAMDSFREAMTDAIGQASSAVGTTLDSIGGIPIIGQAIDFVWEYIGGRLVEEAADVAAEKVKRSRQSGENARAAMVGAIMEGNPNAMVFAELAALLNYPYWIKGRNFRFRPAFRPVVKGGVMFGTNPRPYEGRCGDPDAGALYKIRGPAWRVPATAPRAYMPGPTNPDLYWRVYADRESQTSIKDPWEHVSGSGCDGVTILSALYYPFIISQRKVTDYRIGAREGTGGVNRLLLTYQARLLSDPKTNMGVDLKRAQRLAKNFADWWNAGAVDRGIKIDARKRREGDWTEGQDPDFYMQGGIVRAYRSGKSLASVGVPSPDDPSRLISIGDRNAVIGQTMALGRARAEMLRNTGAMRSLLASDAKLDSGVRKAVEWSAEQSGLLPQVSMDVRPRPGTKPKPIKVGFVDLGSVSAPGESKPKTGRTWPWVVGGTVAAAALGAGAWFFGPWRQDSGQV